MTTPLIESATVTVDIARTLTSVVAALLIFWGGKGLYDFLKGRLASKRRQTVVEARARADAQADWATFSAEMQKALSMERQHGVRQLERIAGLEARLLAADEQVRAEQERVRIRDDHIDALEAHIWQRKPPPPPPRP